MRRHITFTTKPIFSITSSTPCWTVKSKSKNIKNYKRYSVVTVIPQGLNRNSCCPKNKFKPLQVPQLQFAEITNNKVAKLDYCNSKHKHMQWKQIKYVINHTRSFSAASRLFCSRERATMSRSDPMNTIAALSWEPVNTHNRSSRLTCTRVATIEQSMQQIIQHVTAVDIAHQFCHANTWLIEQRFNVPLDTL